MVEALLFNRRLIGAFQGERICRCENPSAEIAGPSREVHLNRSGLFLLGYLIDLLQAQAVRARAEAADGDCYDNHTEGNKDKYP